jgi:hypothetical protein
VRHEAQDSAFASNDQSKVGGWSASKAPAVARLFLPLVGDGPDEWSTWTEVLSRVGLDPELTLSTTWAQIAAHMNSLSLIESVRPSYGVLAPIVKLALGRTADTQVDGPWRLEVAEPFIDVHETFLIDLDDQSPNAAEPAKLSTDQRGAQVYPTLDDLLDAWQDRPFPGRAFIADGSAAVACPPYADSLIVSGSRRWLQDLRELGCEIVHANPDLPLPLMV